MKLDDKLNVRAAYARCESMVCTNRRGCVTGTSIRSGPYRVTAHSATNLSVARRSRFGVSRYRHRAGRMASSLNPFSSHHGRLRETSAIHSRTQAENCRHGRQAPKFIRNGNDRDSQRSSHAGPHIVVVARLSFCDNNVGLWMPELLAPSQSSRRPLAVAGERCRGGWRSRGHGRLESASPSSSQRRSSRCKSSHSPAKCVPAALLVRRLIFRR